MPRFLYLVTAHSNPSQVSRLLRALLAASPEGRVLLHMDSSNEPPPAQDFAEEPRVLFHPCPRPVRWGDFSLVEAVLDAASWARTHAPFDWLVWISGQDYPLGPLRDFEEMLARGRADAWLRHFPGYTHSGWPANEAFRRYGFAYHDIPSFTRDYWFPAPFRRALERGINRFNGSQPLLQFRPRHRNNSAKLGLRLRHTPYSAVFPCIGG